MKNTERISAVCILKLYRFHKKDKNITSGREASVRVDK